MRKKKRTSRSYKKTAKKKIAVNYFSLRDMFDVIVIVVLLSAVVYSSHSLKHRTITAWPQIKYVDVSGNLHASNQEDFKNIVHAHVVGGFFRVPMDDLENHLSELPWVFRATVQRSWPDRLLIHVLQQEPIARWGDTGLMNAYGEVFYPSSIEAYSSLPMLYGERDRSEKLASLFEKSIQKLKPLGLTLRGLFEDERQSKHLVLSNGLVIALGDGEVLEKIQRFITAYKQYLSPHLSQVEKVDLRYTNGLAVEWKNPQVAQNLNWNLNL